MRVLGIDPGISPSLALLSDPDDGSWVGAVEKTDSGDLNAASLVAKIRELKPDLAVVERVQAFPMQGLSSAFDFGTAWGMIRGVLVALGVPYILVLPVKWKTMLADAGYDMGVPNPKGKNKLPYEEKRALDLARREAQKNSAVRFVADHYPAINLYPSSRCTVPDDNLAEAVMLARYGIENAPHA